MKRVSGITLTIVTESPVALSNDQGFGNYTPIKKYFNKDGVHAMTSVATFTYELRKTLFENFGWKLGDVTVKSSNLIFNDVDKMDRKALEADVFGFLIPDKGVSKTSPLRVIPFNSVSTFKNNTQLITNRGFLDVNIERNRFDVNGEPLAVIPSTQALANEEVFGDYYTYTLTIELDRIGVVEVKEGKDSNGKNTYEYLLPEDRQFFNSDIRLDAVKDILNALTILTRDIKHQRILLKPLAVVGGAFENPIPFFWNDIEFDIDDESKEIKMSSVKKTIQDYSLENVIVAVDDSFIAEDEKEILSKMTPVQAIQDLANQLIIGEDNYWYLKD